MKQEDIDKKIGMPDVDAEWAKFEREVIGREKASRKPLYWAIGIAASIALIAGIFLFGHDTEEPQQTIAQQTTPTMQKPSAEETAIEVPVESIVSPKKDVPTIVEAKQRPVLELLAEAQKQTANNEPQDHIAGLTIEPTLADHIAGQDNPQHSERQVSDVKIVGADSVGTLKFLTNYAEGKKLAEHLLIPVDSASESWQEKHKRGAFYDKLRTRLMMPKHVAFGMGCEPSRSNEWSLYYDSVAHALIYSKAEKNIYWATRDALYKEKKIGKDRYQRVLRKHPKSLKKLKVKSYSMPITNEQAQRLKAMWTEAIGCAETKKSFALDGTKIEFPLGALRAKMPKGVNPLVTFTNELAEAVYANDVLHKDSLLAESTLKKCLADAKEAVKLVQFNYDSLIIIVDKQQLPDSLCKLIRNRVRQYYHQQGLMVATWQDWSAYGAKFHSGYDKNCPLIELTTVPDTLSDAYISQHPAFQQSLHHITGIVLSENNEPIPDAWVGVYGEGAGAPTDSAGHFSFWLPRKDVTIQASCLGYITVRITQPANTTLTIRMKSAVRIREVKVLPKNTQ